MLFILRDSYSVFSDGDNNSGFHVDHAQRLRSIDFANVEKNIMMYLSDVQDSTQGKQMLMETLTSVSGPVNNTTILFLATELSHIRYRLLYSPVFPLIC